MFKQMGLSYIYFKINWRGELQRENSTKHAYGIVWHQLNYYDTRLNLLVNPIYKSTTWNQTIVWAILTFFKWKERIFRQRDNLSNYWQQKCKYLYTLIFPNAWHDTHKKTHPIYIHTIILVQMMINYIKGTRF